MEKKPSSFPRLSIGALTPTKKPFLGFKRVNTIIGICRGLLNFKVTRGTKDNFTLTPQGAILELSSRASGVGAGYRGEWTDVADGIPTTQFGTGPFAFGDIIRISPANDWSINSGGEVVPGVYICVQNGAASFPRNPLETDGETDEWHWLSTWPSLRTDCAEDGSQITTIADAQEKPE